MCLTNKVFLAILSVATVSTVEFVTIKKASQNTLALENEASKITDNDDSTCIFIDPNGNELPWLRVELEKIYFVALIRLHFNFKKRGSKVAIRLTNNQYVTPSLENTDICLNASEALTPTNLTCEKKTMAYKFVILMAPINTYLQVCDIKVYGYPERVTSTTLSTNSSVISFTSPSTIEKAPASTAYIFQEFLIPFNMWTIMGIAVLTTLAICPPIIHIFLVNIKKNQRSKKLDQDEEKEVEMEKEGEEVEVQKEKEEKEEEKEEDEEKEEVEVKKEEKEEEEKKIEEMKEEKKELKEEKKGKKLNEEEEMKTK